MPTESGPEGRAPNPPSKRALLLMTAGAVVVGVVVVLGAILPAEYNRDPIGLGRVTGLSRLWAPKEVQVPAAEGDQPLAREYTTPFRSDVVEIPLTSGLDDTTHKYELEYKVRMQKGASLIYAWDVEPTQGPEDFYYDFHGHTVVPKGQEESMTVSTYKQASEPKANGALVAPFDGIHGWYFQNTGVKPVKVRLKLAGFYELVAPGEDGNLERIKPISSSR